MKAFRGSEPQKLPGQAVIRVCLLLYERVNRFRSLLKRSTCSVHPPDCSSSDIPYPCFFPKFYVAHRCYNIHQKSWMSFSIAVALIYWKYWVMEMLVAASICWLTRPAVLEAIKKLKEKSSNKREKTEVRPNDRHKKPTGSRAFLFFWPWVGGSDRKNLLYTYYVTGW